MYALDYKTQQFLVSAKEFRLICMHAYKLTVGDTESQLSLQLKGLMWSSTSCFIAFSASSTHKENAVQGD